MAGAAEATLGHEENLKTEDVHWGWQNLMIEGAVILGNFMKCPHRVSFYLRE